MTTVSISQSASPDGDPVGTVVFVRLKGDIDLAIEPALAQAVDQLRTLTPVAVVVDLADVTFACSTLLGFFARIHRSVPSSTHVTAYGATGMVRRILDIAGTGGYITLQDSDAPEMATAAGPGPPRPGEGDA